MSASYLVDLGRTTLALPSITAGQVTGVWPGSGAVVGNVCDMLHANTYCNVYVAADASSSGQIRLAIQTSDSTASGTFTEPTSGLQFGDLPQGVSSGGLYVINSGGANALAAGFYSVAFQRPQRYARLVALSGFLLDGGFQAGFISQHKNPAVSGFAGYSYSPSSGTPNV